MATHQIKIKSGNPPTAKPYTLEICKKSKDRVKWTSKSKDWVVVFKGASPFERQFFSPAHPGNQKIVVDSTPTEYPYMVCVNGKTCASPIIIVT